MIDVLTANSTGLVVVLGAASLIWAVVQFIFAKWAEAKRLRFETYHSLIKQLVERESSDIPKYLNRQIAVVFELRNFKHYFPVTLRIFRGLRSDWNNDPEKTKGRLLEELELAISHIETKAWRRFW